MLSICGLSFCAMDGPLGMLRRCIDGGELQGTISCVVDVVPRAAWNKDAVAYMETALEIQIIFARSHVDVGLAGFYTNKLLCIRMHFKTNIRANGNIHQCHLQVTAGPKCCSEILVALCCT